MTFEAMMAYQDSQKEIATDALLMAIKNKGKEMEDGRALLKQFLDNCKETNSVFEALRRSLADEISGTTNA